MNYGEALELVHKEIIPFIAFKFEKVYPDAFIKCHTKDEEVYKKANGCMYQWYMVAVNSILKVRFSPKYSQTREETIAGDWNCVQRFYEDLQTTEDFPKFIIENVMI